MRAESALHQTLRAPAALRQYALRGQSRGQKMRADDDPGNQKGFHARGGQDPLRVQKLSCRRDDEVIPATGEFLQNRDRGFQENPLQKTCNEMIP